MLLHLSHPWDLSPADAVTLQEELRSLVVREDRFGEIRAVAGLDVAFEGDVARAAVAVLGFPDLERIEEATAERSEVPPERGSWRPVLDAGEVVGAAVRTRTGVRPVYVSIGHRVSLETAIDLVMRTSPRYRLPEPLRRAHHRTVTL